MNRIVYAPRPSLMTYLLAGTMIRHYPTGLVYWYSGGAIQRGQMTAPGVMVPDHYSMPLSIASEYFRHYRLAAFERFPAEVKTALLGGP